MGKNKDKSSGLSKAQRKALEAREAELLAELEARERAKAAKRSKADDVTALKRKRLRAIVADKDNPKALRKAAKRELARRAEVEDYEPSLADQHLDERLSTAPSPMSGEALGLAPVDEPTKPKGKGGAKAATLAAADKVIATPGSDDAKVAAHTAKAAAEEASEDETDEQIKARVKGKREARQALIDAAPNVDRDDEEAVRIYNDALAQLGGGTFLTSNAERAANDERSAAEASETKPAKAAKRKPDADEVVVTIDGEALAMPKSQVVDEVETERGRIFAAGETPPTTVAADDFAKPSEAPRDDFETNGNGQYKVRPPGAEDGVLKGYTRVTTYIDNLESKTQLETWKMRLLLEGVAITEHPEDATSGGLPEPVSARMRDLIHVRDTKIAKARKADRKGKIAVGELASYIDGAWKDYKRAVDELARTLLDAGGVHEKADKGTDIHALCELYDREGIDAVGDLLTESKITRSDLADVEAYAEALETAGIKVVTEHIERPIVVDDIKVAGRLDRIYMVRLPGSQRAVRVVGDIKTGRVDYSAGKIAQQLEMYSRGQGYDLDTHERTDLKASKTKALLVHLPAGTATCSIYPVDLSTGRKGNALSAQVRAWRNEGKRAIDFDTDLAAKAVS